MRSSVFYKYPDPQQAFFTGSPTATDPF